VNEEATVHWGLSRQKQTNKQLLKSEIPGVPLPILLPPSPTRSGTMSAPTSGVEIPTRSGPLRPPAYCHLSTRISQTTSVDSCRLLYQLLECQWPFEAVLGTKPISPLVMRTPSDRATDSRGQNVSQDTNK